jgi:hypothetical protein
VNSTWQAAVYAHPRWQALFARRYDLALLAPGAAGGRAGKRRASAAPTANAMPAAWLAECVAGAAGKKRPRVVCVCGGGQAAPRGDAQAGPASGACGGDAGELLPRHDWYAMAAARSRAASAVAEARRVAAARTGQVLGRIPAAAMRHMAAACSPAVCPVCTCAALVPPDASPAPAGAAMARHLLQQHGVAVAGGGRGRPAVCVPGGAVVGVAQQ